MSTINLYTRDIAQFKHRCSYQDKYAGGSRFMDDYRAVDSVKLEQIKRHRVKCPQCGRRMWGWKVITCDADFYYYAIPPHKVKKWWKKKKGGK